MESTDEKYVLKGPTFDPREGLFWKRFGWSILASTLVTFATIFIIALLLFFNDNFENKIIGWFVAGAVIAVLVGRIPTAMGYYDKWSGCYRKE